MLGFGFGFGFRVKAHEERLRVEATAVHGGGMEDIEDVLRAARLLLDLGCEKQRSFGNLPGLGFEVWD